MTIDFLSDNETINISPKHHKIAQQYAQKQVTKLKARQVYLNTLAVLAVNEFLPEINYQGNLDASDSFKPVILVENTGHLKVENININLECRPILPNETEINIPEEVTKNRDFYIAVQFQESLNKVEILGFCSDSELVCTEDYATISLDKLTPIDELINHLFSLEKQINSENYLRDNIVTEISNKSIQLLKILEGELYSGYMSIQEAIAQKLLPKPSYLFAGEMRYGEDENKTITTCKVINLGEEKILLKIELKDNNTNNLNLKFMLENIDKNQPLPSELEIVLEDEDEKLTWQIKEQKKQNKFEQEFDKKYGEQFNLNLILGEATFQENYTI